MENKVSKPLSVARRDFMDSMIELVNESGLPPFVLESVVKDIYNEIRILSQRQLEADLKQYNELLSQKVQKAPAKEGETNVCSN